MSQQEIEIVKWNERKAAAIEELASAAEASAAAFRLAAEKLREENEAVARLSAILEDSHHGEAD